jgi:hypothetical protein
MSVNTLTFEQVSTVLTSIVKQATGQTVLTPTDTGSFVSVGQIVLRADRDAVMNAISNLVGRTLFAIRPLDDVMPGLEMDSFRWGNVMRKLSIADSDWKDDPAYAWPATYDATQTDPNGDGGAIDPWTIKKPDILQTNFYGASVYFDEMSIFEDQIETAFSGPEQLGSFLSLIMTNLSNRLTFSNESIKRGLVCNAIGSLYHENDSNRVIHLLTEYNTACGFSTPLTVNDIYQPDNFPAFMKWMYARIANITDLFKANSEMFQTIVSGKHILRHTPLEMQRVYLYSPLLQQMSARVLADTYHENFLRYSDVESLTFWQSIRTPDTVKVTPMYTNTSGALATTTAQTVENVVGLIFDRDALGMTILDRRVLSTPLNTKGLYRNLHVHAKQRVFMDNTEKMALLLLD